MKYSPGFRASVVRKTQDGSGRSINQLARETGVSYTTISNWVEQHRIGKLSLDDADGITPDQRNPGRERSDSRTTPSRIHATGAWGQ